ncbi:hypothetical protein TNIN_48151 [Trichonephila inaurata madagascariensis]|uniref:Uncharacterized protein n=1 Tax=Trichonephila inaurata madagascariensis TaxID=2747483 RepID=A0A8X7CQM8_9ARAC|nr:hypothetical protein TNIN_48151 [Trichonephila inaurata madagascariensis]
MHYPSSHDNICADWLGVDFVMGIEQWKLDPTQLKNIAWIDESMFNLIHVEDGLRVLKNSLKQFYIDPYPCSLLQSC